jgi:hypothetical protein
MTITRRTKKFRVAAISDKANSFGLTGHILVARDGQGFEVGRSRAGEYPEPWKVGQDITVPFTQVGDEALEPAWGEICCEIPRSLPRCPPNVLASLYP